MSGPTLAWERQTFPVAEGSEPLYHDGKTFVVYSAGGGCDMNRSTCAQRFTWNPDGTPNFGAPVRLGVTLPAPAGEPRN